MGVWIFVRHGQSTANARRVLSGWDDVALTDLGRQQARQVGRNLKHQFPEIQRWISSDLDRARETAQLAMGTHHPESAPLIEEPRLRARNLGSFQGQSYDTIRDQGQGNLLRAWQGRPPGGESLRDLGRRSLDALIDLDKQDVETTAIFAHGGVLRVLTGIGNGLTIEALSQRRIENATPIVVRLPFGAWAQKARKYGYFLSD